ncbi:hypothetical protein QR680_015652 [Steinernema hermaphroditum]|uniref:Uncharacterized protein n=1 Tax=Steinernema hermaphroditum TaxID=289476 RepID=A0AA39LKZ8_9BILA|nr:hypothetical protein QR680_015652 [Steinernema hermaphroditum]
MLRFALFALLCAQLATAQMIKQCTCADVQQCETKAVDQVIPCSDECKQHAAKLGANYNLLKKCIIDKERMIVATMECTEKALSNSCAAAPGKMVQKRYPETLKIAALAEINKMLGRSGIAGQTKSMLATGKKFAGCVKTCLDKRSGNCANKLGCGLDLPSDNQLVQIAKGCAIKSGFNTAAVQSVCNCAAQAGVTGLAGICNKIVIS